MIPRLNSCDYCNEEGPAESQLRRDAVDMHRGLHDLFFAYLEALRIDRLAEWLAKRLP